MTPLTADDVFLYESQKVCYLCKRGFCYNKKQKKRFKLYKKVRDHFKFHNGSKYDYHFMITELPKEFIGDKFESLGENTEKYISFSVPIKKEHDNDGGETITYKIKFIDSCRSMLSRN